MESRSLTGQQGTHGAGAAPTHGTNEAFTLQAARLRIVLCVSHSSVFLTPEVGSGVPKVGMNARNALVLMWTCPSRVSYPGAAGPELVERWAGCHSSAGPLGRSSPEKATPASTLCQDRHSGQGKETVSRNVICLSSPRNAFKRSWCKNTCYLS